MAAITTGPEYVGPTITPPFVRGVPTRLSWGALFGGMFVAIGTGVLLMALGLAIGLSSVDPTNPESAKHAGVGTGIWALVVPIFSLFVGGLVAARAAGTLERATALIHGAVLWGLTTLIAVYALGAGVSALTSTAVSAGTSVLSAVGTAGIGAAEQGAGPLVRALGIDMNDVLAPVNQRLRAEGKPTITPDELQASIQETVSSAIREGRLDRDVLATSIANNTRLSRRDAEDLAARYETQFNQKRAQLGQQVEGTKREAQETALRAMDTAGKGMWWVTLGHFLGLAAAVIGAFIGVSRRQRVAAGEPVAPPPIATTREVTP